jgi:L-alanine-DL-glutamate epimerase-like enolase superfamily enzyme
MSRKVRFHRQSFPIKGGFRIARGAKVSADVVVVEIEENGLIGRGECVPYNRYGETVEGVVATLASVAGALEGGLDRASLQDRLPPGAARNAVDCALWDLDAKCQGRPAWQIAGGRPPGPLVTAFTLSLDSPEAMAAGAAAEGQRPLFKLKLGAENDADGDLRRVRAVHAAVPEARLLVDPNEGWTVDTLAALAPHLAGLGVHLIEQPIPAAMDERLRGLALPVPLAADESFHDAGDIDRMRGLYQAVVVKLDKTGGLTEGLRTRDRAAAAGLAIMVSCMVSTSLSMAPAHLLAQGAAYVDLDGPLLLTEDRPCGLTYQGSLVFPPRPQLWG